MADNHCLPANEEEEEDDDDEIYENLDDPRSTTASIISSVDSHKSVVSSPSESKSRFSYDEVTVNFGKPVIHGLDNNMIKSDQDLFGSVTFASPIQDLSLAERQCLQIPIPAPRPSKAKPMYEDINNKNIQQPPQVPPRNINKNNSNEGHQYENIYSEIHSKEEEVKNLMDLDEEDGKLGARPRRTTSAKGNTIDIRNTIKQWYEEATLEIERDLSLDLSVLEEDLKQQQQPPKPKPRLHEYEHIALDKGTVTLVEGHVVNKSLTLLRDFDPCFDQVILEDGEDEQSCTSSSSSSSSSQSSMSEQSEARALSPDDSPALDDAILDPIKEKKDGLKCKEDVMGEKSENVYVTMPRKSVSSSEDLPPPTTPPPPLPATDPPVARPLKKISYENVWLGHAGQLLLQAPSRTPPPVPIEQAELPAVPPRTTYAETPQDALSVASSSCSDEVGNTPQRSFSATHISRLASNIKRKMSDQGLVPSLTSRRRSALLQGHGLTPGTKTQTGVLFVMPKKGRKVFQPKWCVLGNGTFRYYNDKQTLAIPKESVAVNDIISLSVIEEPVVQGDLELHCVDVIYLIPGSGRAKGSKRTAALSSTLPLAASTRVERDNWLDKLAHSLCYQLANFSMAKCHRLGWVHLKTGFAGTWHRSWVSLRELTMNYTGVDYLIDKESVDLKKVKNTTMVKDVKNLAAPDQSLPVLVVDCLDRSLYMQPPCVKECQRLAEAIESVAFDNGNRLDKQQLTGDDIPVVVDKCISFVYSHGCMTEGIYRHSGVNTKIIRLLDQFRVNAWAVHITRDTYSEHDVANTLKRFLRTLDEPLLTERLRSMWMQASALSDTSKKLERYKHLLKLLPSLNYNTLRRLMSHLVCISEQAGKNLMPNYNLAAIWGPTLLTVDGQEASNFAQTTGESDVCRDLIDHYRLLFNVNQDEIEREKKIIGVLEKLNRHDRGRCLLKRSGDLRMWVYIDTKSSGNCVCVVVQPSMTALEMTRKVLLDQQKNDQSDHVNNLVLHEVILGGALERPIHHSELMLDVTLKWGSWPEQDRRDNYLLIKRNLFYEEALPCAKPPMSVFGEAYYGDKKGFKKHLLSMNNARLTVSKDSNSGLLPVELGSWPIEDICWYFGCEAKRKPPHHLNVTFISKDSNSVIRAKEKPNFFGKTVSFESREFFIKWIAAMLVAEHSNDIVPKEPLLLID